MDGASQESERALSTNPMDDDKLHEECGAGRLDRRKRVVR